VIDPVGNYKTAQEKMFDVTAISVFDALIGFDEWIRGELIAKIHQLALPSLWET
jgi:hypothetical protein